MNMAAAAAAVAARRKHRHDLGEGSDEVDTSGNADVETGPDGNQIPRRKRSYLHSICKEWFELKKHCLILAVVCVILVINLVDLLAPSSTSELPYAADLLLQMKRGFAKVFERMDDTGGVTAHNVTESVVYEEEATTTTATEEYHHDYHNDTASTTTTTMATVLFNATVSLVAEVIKNVTSNGELDYDPNNNAAAAAVGNVTEVEEDDDSYYR